MQGLEFRISARAATHPGDIPGATIKSISHRCHPTLVEFVWELTKETIHLPLGCLQGGGGRKYVGESEQRRDEEGGFRSQDADR